MAKRAFIIHNWGGSPKGHWYPWLKRELEKKGFDVIIPVMPDTKKPTIAKWTAALAKSVKKVDSDTYFVGHSIGCQTIIRYLTTQDKKCGGVVFVAGWFALTPAAASSKTDIATAKPWLFDTIDFAKAKRLIPKSVALLSDDDLYVPINENATVFQKLIKSKIIIEKDKGHYTKEEGVMEVPTVLKELTSMVR